MWCTIAKIWKKPKSADKKLKKKKDVVCAYSAIKFNHEKEGNPDIFKNMDGPKGHYAKWNKTERQILCFSFISEIQKQKNKKQKQKHHY